MRDKANRFFNLLVQVMDKTDHWREWVLRGLLESHVLVPLRKVGLTADLLTAIRVALGVVLCYFVGTSLLFNGYDPGFETSFLDRRMVLAMLSLGFLTDLLDGPLARIELRDTRVKITITRGAHFDPLADKILTLPILAFFIPALGLIKGLAAVFSIFGDAVSIAIRRYSGKRGIIIPANRFGKYKMVFLCAAIFQLVWQYPKGVDIAFGMIVASMTLGSISIFINAREVKRQLDAKGSTGLASGFRAHL